MHSFDTSDFSKSALSLSAGMGAVVAAVAWRTNGDLLVICLTGGLPTGVLILWAVYSLKLFWTRREDAKREAKLAQREAINSGIDANLKHLAQIVMPLGIDRAVLRPNNQSLRKERALTGRAQFPDETGTTAEDQWYE